jgi:peptidoglycan/LPS O-acetylase OafA/YrhL
VRICRRPPVRPQLRKEGSIRNGANAIYAGWQPPSAWLGSAQLAVRRMKLSSEAAGPIQSTGPRLSARHIAGLDSLRFVCAIWVALHHGARPHVALWLGLSPVFHDWNAIAYDGVAAVIVFFIISGVCVHLSYARSEQCHLPAFFAQRCVRIGIPLLVVIAVEFLAYRLGAAGLGDDVAIAMRMVSWSLWCELIFYALYPVFLIGFRRIGFIPMIGAAYVAAYLTIFDHWQLLTYWQYSSRVAWLTALPVWLLGCALAQVIAMGRLPALPGSIWLWRIGAVLLSIPPKALVYASVTPILIGNPATLGLYAVFACFWLMKEIRFYQDHPAPPLLEWGGRWSYSIYLIHNIVLVAFAHHLVHPYGLAVWPAEFATVLSLAYVFYRLVEDPSHRLARALGRSLGSWHVRDGVAITGPAA